ncbi:hypothetical protein Y032_0036g3246 [Ancylostoma ceylanicum]|nr:hypothetical protein Y032_0036g3246 [Ancylostoma ceylanicum]
MTSDGQQKSSISSNTQTLPMDFISNNFNDSSIEEVNQREGVADYLFQGDIILTEEQLDSLEASLVASTVSRAKRQARRTGGLWTNKNVYYYFDASLSTRKRTMVQTALNYIKARTCLQFVENAAATNRIRVFNGAGCYSYVGMTGGEQELSLGDGCEMMGIVAHEFMHAFGMYHMQMRDDRDTYVTIDLSSVATQSQNNFVKLPSSSVINYNPYEYGSVMHYDAKSFSSTGNYTIIPVDASYLRTIGARAISFYDIKTINDHYKCHARCGAGSAKCVNAGYPNPRNCKVCNCPAGYGGATCNVRPAGCGEALVATALWKVRQFTFGDATVTGSRDTYMTCNHRVQAPAGKRVQIRITSLDNAYCRHGCNLHAIEPKIRNNKRVTNPRICCSDELNKVFTSTINPTPIVSYNRYQTSTYTFHYRFI